METKRVVTQQCSQLAHCIAVQCCQVDALQSIMRARTMYTLPLLAMLCKNLTQTLRRLDLSVFYWSTWLTQEKPTETYVVSKFSPVSVSQLGFSDQSSPRCGRSLWFSLAFWCPQSWPLRMKVPQTKISGKAFKILSYALLLDIVHLSLYL